MLLCIILLLNWMITYDDDDAKLENRINTGKTTNEIKQTYIIVNCLI